MKILIFLTVCLLSLSAVSQISTTELKPDDKNFFPTIVSAAKYLKQQKTVPLAFHESPQYSIEESFYDEVIKKFFDQNKTLELFSKDTSLFAIEGKMDIIRHILNGADYFLDIIPEDSIYVRSYKELKNVLEIYVMIDNRDVLLLLCYFDPISNFLVDLAGGAIPRTPEFIGYLKRQKNYYEFPDPRNRN